MKSFLLFFALVVAMASAFAPVAIPQSSTTSTTELGMFNFGGKKKPAADPNQQDANVFAGRGKKITIREDEDAAMWIEDPEEAKNKKPWWQVKNPKSGK